MRASVFANMVRKDLEAAGWKVEQAPETKKGRDWLAKKGDQSVRIVPVFATSQPSEVLTSVKIASTSSFKGSTEGYLITIPERSATNTSEKPRVVKLNNLLSKLPR